MSDILTQRLREEGWCTVSEAAAITGLYARKIYRWVDTNALAFKRVGGPTNYVKTGERQAGTLYINLPQLFQLLGRDVVEIALKHPPSENVTAPLSFLPWLKEQHALSGDAGWLCGLYNAARSRPNRILSLEELVRWLVKTTTFSREETTNRVTPVWQAWRTYYTREAQKTLRHEEQQLQKAQEA